MRERTEAYFKQYVEIKDQEWTIVYPKEEESDYKWSPYSHVIIYYPY